MKYKLSVDPYTNQNSVKIQKADGTYSNGTIPFDPANSDYREYLEWVAQGNTAVSADTPPQAGSGAGFDETATNIFTAQQTFRRNGSSDDAVVVTENSDTAARVKLATDGSITFATDTNNWKIAISGTNLIFSADGVDKMKLDASGNLIVVGNISAYGTV